MPSSMRTRSGRDIPQEAPKKPSVSLGKRRRRDSEPPQELGDDQEETYKLTPSTFPARIYKVYDSPKHDRFSACNIRDGELLEVGDWYV